MRLIILAIAVVGITTTSGGFGMTYQIGAVRVAILGDEEIFLSSHPGVPSSFANTNDLSKFGRARDPYGSTRTSECHYASYDDFRRHPT
jgi:hypothetical protein